ncbi:hypothetical protein ACKVMT_12000 [Halobacteriales archaeon Cl-PHB]
MANIIDAESLSGLEWLAVGLVAVTGILHLVAGLEEARIPVALAGVGFLAAIGLYLVDYRRRLLVLLAIPYTLVQFPLWYAANAGEFAPLGYADKAVQAALVVVLVVIYWRQREAGSTDGAVGA